MRVYDLALRAKVPKTSGPSGQLPEATRSAVVVHAQQVSEWFFAQRRELEGNGKSALQLIERCVPPFECVMVEFHRPDLSLLPHIGVVVTREETDRGYLLGCGIWLSDLRKLTLHYPAISQVPVSEDGVPDWTKHFLEFDDSVDESQKDDYAKMFVEFVATALLAFRFMHARGVQVNEVLPARHERRQADREGLPAPVTYKTLEIGVMKRILETEGDIGNNGIAKAMHICRGHFADYTRGKGLFGKHRVEVFVPEHVKGRREKGVVIKDYNINTSLGGEDLQ